MRAQKRIAVQRERRRFRIRNRVRRDANGRPRLSVFRSNKHISAQIIDDSVGFTVVSANSLDKSLQGEGFSGGNKDAAAAVGRLIAERAKEKGITAVVFDRGEYRYHGRVEALAAAAREAGLDF